MHYIPSKKLNNEPLLITLSGIAVGVLDLNTEKRVIDPEHPANTWSEWLWDRFAGSGLNRAEVNTIADAFYNRNVILIGDGEYRRGYINGKLIETPTQHVLFVGHAGQPHTVESL